MQISNVRGVEVRLDGARLENEKNTSVDPTLPRRRCNRLYAFWQIAPFDYFTVNRIPGKPFEKSLDGGTESISQRDTRRLSTPFDRSTARERRRRTRDRVLRTMAVSLTP